MMKFYTEIFPQEFVEIYEQEHDPEEPLAFGTKEFEVDFSGRVVIRVGTDKNFYHLVLTEEEAIKVAATIEEILTK